MTLACGFYCSGAHSDAETRTGVQLLARTWESHIYAGRSSDVQCEHFVALAGTALRQ